jgi:hypothetical protein
VFDRFRELVAQVRLALPSRADFYAAARGPDLAIALATGVEPVPGPRQHHVVGDRRQARALRTQSA